MEFKIKSLVGSRPRVKKIESSDLYVAEINDV